VFGFPYHMGGGMWFLVAFEWLFWILAVGLIVFLVVRLLRSDGSRSGPTYRRDEAEEILHRRLANGEIDVDEYERRMSALRAQRLPRP
jgi:putative membrane protein